MSETRQLILFLLIVFVASVSMTVVTSQLKMASDVAKIEDQINVLLIDAAALRKGEPG